MGNINTSNQDKDKYKTDIKNMITISRTKHIYENINEIVDIKDSFLFLKTNNLKVLYQQ
jgi:hypothetical protein